MRSLILTLMLSLPAAAATEDFTAWTETDTGGYLAVSESSVVATNVPRDAICYVYKNYGASYWNGDFSVNFQFVPGAVSHTDTDSFLGLCAFTNALYNWYNLSVNGGAGVTPVYSRDTTGYKLFLWMVKSGSEWYAFSDNIYVSLGTTYYVTFARDYDAGTYEKGLYTLTVCTGNYYGESGASLVGQETLDAPTAASTDFQYVLTGLSKLNGGVQTASGTISNLEFIEAGGEAPTQAANPYPVNEAVGVSTAVTLHWGAIAEANDYNVYFGTTSLSLVGNVDANEYDPDLDPGMAYQWRIDPNNEYGTTEGAVWTFATALPKVTTPSPADEQRDVPIDQVLAWSASAGATDYDIYLGPALGSLSLLANITGATYAPALAHGQAYDWRVDPNNTTGATTGDVWTFYTETVPAEPNEPAPPEEGDSPSEWRTTRPWRGTPHWIRREGLEGWRKR